MRSVEGSAVCYWEHLTKRLEKYLVTWASVGGSKLWWGLEPPAAQPPPPLATGLR